MSQDKKVAAKNVQVGPLYHNVCLNAVVTHVHCQIRAYARHADGTLQPCLRRGSAQSTTLAPSYESAVYYHNNNPTFAETVRALGHSLSAPVVTSVAQFCFCIPRTASNGFETTHLVFQVVHVSSSPSKTHCFAFSFLELANKAGVAIADGVHEVGVCANGPSIGRA